MTQSLPVTIKRNDNKIEGHAVKASLIHGWTVFLTDGTSNFSVQEADLLDEEKYDVEKPELVLTSEQSSKQKKKILRQLMKQEREKVELLKKEATQKRKVWISQKYDRIKE